MRATTRTTPTSARQLIHYQGQSGGDHDLGPIPPRFYHALSARFVDTRRPHHRRLYVGHRCVFLSFPPVATMLDFGVLTTTTSAVAAMFVAVLENIRSDKKRKMEDDDE